ncbi:Clp protease-domain-containing protein [Mrakia frigida]|uniref:Clp protease-domain-containing protein n=1 Tax=Mrakia frigida TaxID=29902 RepID=UPI003FCC190A
MSLRSPLRSLVSRIPFTFSTTASSSSVSCLLSNSSRRPLSSTSRLRAIIPQVTERTANGERSQDLFSRLLKERVLFVGDIDSSAANLIMGQLLYLEAADSEKPVQMYINSRGGNFTDVMAVFDTMTFMRPPVHTVCLGHASSLSSLLLAAGEKGHRTMLPNATVMIHQPRGGRSGQQSDIAIAAKETLRQREQLERLYQVHCGKEGESVEEGRERFRTAMERDFHLNAEEAIAFGIADKVSRPKEKEVEEKDEEKSEVVVAPTKEAAGESSVPPSEEVKVGAEAEVKKA